MRFYKFREKSWEGDAREFDCIYRLVKVNLKQNIITIWISLWRYSFISGDYQMQLKYKMWSLISFRRGYQLAGTWKDLSNKTS